MVKEMIFTTCFILFLSTVIHANTTKVSRNEYRNWLRYVIPLPHEIAIQEKITLKPGDISITLRDGADDIEKNAADSLKRLFAKKTGAVPSGTAFEIIVGTLDTHNKVAGITIGNADRLNGLQNNDQAYIIRPLDNKLILTGLNGKGVYYAVMTLMQLIEPYMTKESVTLPLAEIVDWPDIDERGLWLFSNPPEWIPWLASMKINWGEMGDAVPQNIERGKPNKYIIDKDLMMEARLMAFKYHPFIYHFNFLQDWGLFRAYPELAGVGDGALSGRYFAHTVAKSEHRVPCASQPLFTEILIEWMMDLARQGVDEVSCWLSERPAQCGCDECTAAGQFVLEARASVRAWQETRKTYPGFVIRLFLSTTTSERYYKVLAESPPEVKIERACANWIERVPHSPRDLLVNPLLDHYADQGRWIASYDVPIGAYGLVDTPEVKVPCSSAHRIRDHVGQLFKRNWSGAYGMMAWDNFFRGGKFGREIYGFNITALAEWAWNSDGRTEKEFAAAWAVREDYENPEAVSEWSELMGPVEFDVYDSGFPISYSWGQAVRMIDERTRPLLGEGMFRYYASSEDFDSKIEVCDRALKIAGAFKNPYLANETKVVRSYIMLAKCIFDIAELVALNDLATLQSQKKLSKSLDRLNKTGDENVTALRKWRSDLGPEPWHFRFHAACKATEKTVADISQIIKGKYFY